MKITQITARGLQGRDFTIAPGAVTFLVGENKTGKTAVMRAIQFALLGYVPKLGMKPASTAGMASARSMEVEVQFDNGQRLTRCLKLKGDTVSVTKQVPPEIADCEQIAAMMDASVYFGLTPRQRVEYVAANCPPIAGGLTEAAIRLRVFEKSGTPTYALPLTKNDDHLPVGTWVDQAILDAAEALKGINAYAERMEHTVQGLGHLRLATAEPPAGKGEDTAALNAEIQQLS
jgi:hypothetical protein